jgi:Ser/Thr protein kinase RdoA (MazF antagonist)
MRELASLVLAEYGLQDAPFKLVLQAGNTLFRVYGPAPSPAPDDDLFEPGQYLLRIYAPGWQPPEAIRLELAWLAAMRREAGLPVPEPVARPDGTLLTRIHLPGMPEPRYCALLQWMKGRLLTRGVGEQHFRAQGELMARMHDFTRSWQLPAGHNKRNYDWSGLFMNDSELGLPAGACWNYLPPAWKPPFESVARSTRLLMDEWGQGPEVYGLIHADMGTDANVLFRHGQPRPIDFDGSGLGYWLYDIAVAQAHLWDQPAFPAYRQAFLDGYTRMRTLPDWQLAKYDQFLAAFFVYYALWMVGAIHLQPESRGHFQPVLDRAAAYVLHFVENQSAR